MKTNALVNAINEICQERSLDRDLVIATIEEAILISARKKYVEYENIEVGFNIESGEFELTALKEVVETVEDPQNQVELKEMLLLDPDTELGDFLEHRIEADDFKNVIAQTTRVTLFQKIKEIEREHISQKYSDKVKTIVYGKVGKIDRRRALVLLNDNAEAVLEYNEQIPNEKLHSGENIRAMLLAVKNEMKGPQLFLSRTHPDFLKQLFDQEIPEVYEGLINVFNVARDPGRRAKVAVSSNDPDIDPVGSCVGPKGSRIQPIVAELCGERIDIIEHTNDDSQFIRRALSPGQVVSMTLDTDEKVADVDIEPETLSIAIGKQGQNVKLASILTKYTINVMPAKTEADEIAEAPEETKTEASTEGEAEAPAEATLAEETAPEATAPETAPEASAEEPVEQTPGTAEAKPASDEVESSPETIPSDTPKETESEQPAEASPEASGESADEKRPDSPTPEEQPGESATALTDEEPPANESQPDDATAESRPAAGS